MIFNIIIGILISVLLFFISLLPDGIPLPTIISDSFATLSTYLGQANTFFPIDTALQIIGLGIVVELSIVTFKMFNWVLNKIRGSG